MDDGTPDGPPGRDLRSAWITLTKAEAYDLLESLKFWAEEIEAGHPDQAWHHHILDSEERELSFSVSLEGDTAPPRA